MDTVMIILNFFFNLGKCLLYQDHSGLKRFSSSITSFAHVTNQLDEICSGKWYRFLVYGKQGSGIEFDKATRI